ncbi:Imidazole glycerol phosphate synthase amidotransferase subunit [hydrothermal vent metagenome]|uniref:Imidazole glycerol phosphate synthase amidotransferase subunit n=1 Tax=hydrothermal vent metagenome TaxID=652676 RepID=A0A1W1BB77_9ZZZZ
MRIVIIDYGMGNIKSITSALKYLGVNKIIVSSSEEEIRSADKLILPGVGSFSQAMQNIKKLGLDTILNKAVLEEKKPILGICLGMQLMCSSSEENGFNKGLAFISGKVQKFKEDSLKVPHVGFNQVNSNKNSKLYKDLDNLSDFYFTHSYRLTSDAAINQATCTYIDEFIVSYEFKNITGVQFHPELSQINGLKLLDNFIKNF